MRGKRIFLILALTIPVMVSFSAQRLHADTIIMQDKQELKGVVVEDFEDRIVLSTMEGEKQVMKKEIKDIIYDLEEQNLTSIGDYYQDREMYDKAQYYYQKALKVNPNYERAKDGLNYVTTILREGESLRNISQMDRLKEINDWKKNAQTGALTRQEELEKEVGISLRTIRGSFYISLVVPGSPAEKAGLRKADKIVAVWGRPIRYARPSEVMNKLLNPVAMDPRVTISRTYTLELKTSKGRYSDVIGARLGFAPMNGLMVQKVSKEGSAYAAGLQKGDVVTEIQGEPLRYRSLKEVDDIINSSIENILSMVVERDLVIWREFVKTK
jgi:C-terminal processing protease CtpA/Prc